MVSITKWLIIGLAGAFAISALVDPQRAFATTQAFKGVGTSLGSLGTGVQSLLTGVGTGTAKLFNPLFTLRDLIYGPQAGVQVQKDVAEVVSTDNTPSTQAIVQTQQSIEKDPISQFTPLPFADTKSMHFSTDYKNPYETPNILPDLKKIFGFFSNPTISPAPVSNVRIHGQTLPLSQAAINYYQKRGVSVSPVSNQTVASQNAGNATSGYSAGARTSHRSTGGFGAAN